MPFGMVSGVGRGMGVLDGGGDRRILAFILSFGCHQWRRHHRAPVQGIIVYESCWLLVIPVISSEMINTASAGSTN